PFERLVLRRRVDTPIAGILVSIARPQGQHNQEYDTSSMGHGRCYSSSTGDNTLPSQMWGVGSNDGLANSPGISRLTNPASTLSMRHRPPLSGMPGLKIPSTTMSGMGLPLTFLIKGIPMAV